ncbi:hypothetical protein M3D75_06565, partial [Microbacterium enclense]
MGPRRHTRHRSLVCVLVCATLVAVSAAPAAAAPLMAASGRVAAIGDDDPAVREVQSSLDAAEAAAAAASRRALDTSATAERTRLTAEA